MNSEILGLVYVAGVVIGFLIGAIQEGRYLAGQSEIDLGIFGIPLVLLWPIALAIALSILPVLGMIKLGEHLRKRAKEREEKP